MKKVNELLVERGIHIPKVETHTPEIKTQQIVDSFVKKNEEEGLRIFVAGGSRSGNSPVYEETEQLSIREKRDLHNYIS